MAAKTYGPVAELTTVMAAGALHATPSCPHVDHLVSGDRWSEALCGPRRMRTAAEMLGPQSPTWGRLERLGWLCSSSQCAAAWSADDVAPYLLDVLTAADAWVLDGNVDPLVPGLLPALAARSDSARHLRDLGIEHVPYGSRIPAAVVQSHVRRAAVRFGADPAMLSDVWAAATPAKARMLCEALARADEEAMVVEAVVDPAAVQFGLAAALQSPDPHLPAPWALSCMAGVRRSQQILMMPLWRAVLCRLAAADEVWSVRMSPCGPVGAWVADALLPDDPPAEGETPTVLSGPRFDRLFACLEGFARRGVPEGA